MIRKTFQRPDMKMKSQVDIKCLEAIATGGILTVPNGLFAGQLQKRFPELRIRIRDNG